MCPAGCEEDEDGTYYRRDGYREELGFDYVEVYHKGDAGRDEEKAHVFYEKVACAADAFELY
jgi:hypothetical protein